MTEVRTEIGREKVEKEKERVETDPDQVVERKDKG